MPIEVRYILLITNTVQTITCNGIFNVQINKFVFTLQSHMHQSSMSMLLALHPSTLHGRCLRMWKLDRKPISIWRLQTIRMHHSPWKNMSQARRSNPINFSTKRWDQLVIIIVIINVFLVFLFLGIWKPNLDPNICHNYRSISYLTFLSNTLERCIAVQVVPLLQHFNVSCPAVSLGLEVITPRERPFVSALYTWPLTDS